ncbi:MAG: zinc ribbon domain-containing protein [Ignavibacteriales bacterium]
MFFNILQAKAEEAGHTVIKVPPRNTSQRCSNCGAIVKKSLSQRIHRCMNCKIVLHRDLNSALEIHRLGQSLQPITSPLSGVG